MAEEELKDFIIEEDEKIEGTVDEKDPLDELLEEDFSKDDGFDYNKYYEYLKELKTKNTREKIEEPSKVLCDLAPAYLDEELFNSLTFKMQNMDNYIRKYSTEYSDIINYPSEDKDKIYGLAEFLWKSFSKEINDLQFNLTLTRDEYKFIQTTMEHKMEYNGNEVFNVVELKETYLDTWRMIDKTIDKNIPSFVVNIDIKNLVMLYHFLSKYIVKGLGKEYYTFKGLLTKIAECNKIFNALNVLTKNYSEKFQIWAGAITSPSELEASGVNFGEPIASPNK